MPSCALSLTVRFRAPFQTIRHVRVFRPRSQMAGVILSAAAILALQIVLQFITAPAAQAHCRNYHPWHCGLGDVADIVVDPVGTIRDELERCFSGPCDPSNLDPYADYVGNVGRVLYPEAAALMAARHEGSTKWALTRRQKETLRPYLGDVVDRASVVYNARLTEYFGSYDGMTFRFPGFTEAGAQTFGSTMYIRSSQSNSEEELMTVAHELVHVLQFEALGNSYTEFGYTYFKGYARAGYNYFGIPLEMEAYQREKQIELEERLSFGTPYLDISDFGSDDGWRVDRHPRMMADANGDGSADVIGFANDGVWVSLSQGLTFSALTRVVREFGSDGGWRVDRNPRMMADVNGDGRADIVGFANDGVWVSLSQGSTFAEPTRVVREFGADGGWRVDRNPRMMADVNTDGQADIVGFANDGVWVSLSQGSTFALPEIVANRFGYNTGNWRVDQHPRMMADVNGDGGADIVGFGDAGTWFALSPG